MGGNNRKDKTKIKSKQKRSRMANNAPTNPTNTTEAKEIDDGHMPTGSNTPDATNTDFGEFQVAPMDTTPATPKETSATTSAAMSTAEHAVVSAPVKAKKFWLQFSTLRKPFCLPTYAEVALAGQMHFQQEGMKCIPIRIISETCYKFELLEEVESEGHSLSFNDFDVPLSVWQQRQNMQKKEGLLLTLRRAGMGDLEAVPSEAFDAAIQHLKLNLLVSTKFQRVKDTRVLNGNRFCVVETPTNVKQIPESIPVVDPNTKVSYQVLVNFRGQERFCYGCNEMHVGECPKVKERREKYAVRDAFKKDINTKLYSDSTLRCADVLGLRCEILCMSGGGLGQVIQAAIDDPVEHEKIVIFGGANDKKYENFPATDVYAHNVDMALLKLGEHALEKENKTFYLVQQAPIAPQETAHGDAVIRDLYLARRMKELAENHNNIETVMIGYDADHTGHPTLPGTQAILEKLNAVEITSNPLIWDHPSISTDKPYSKIQSVFRYGCNGCDRYGKDFTNSTNSNPLLCDHCFEAPKTNNPEALLRKIAKRVEETRTNPNEEDYPYPKRVRENGAAL